MGTKALPLRLVSNLSGVCVGGEGMKIPRPRPQSVTLGERNDIEGLP